MGAAAALVCVARTPQVGVIQCGGSVKCDASVGKPLLTRVCCAFFCLARAVVFCCDWAGMVAEWVI